MNFILAVILTILGTICAASGQILLKKAAPRMSISVEGTFKNFPFLVGLFLYGMSMILCIVALKGGELSVLNPLSSLNYVWAAFLSMWFLGEKMNKYKWIGIILIIIGVSVIVH
jgi:uncharacterized membrane protein